MAVRRTVQPALVPPTPILSVIPAGAEEKGTALLAPVRQSADDLEVVDQESYEAADELLHQIQVARKKWNREMYGEDGKAGPIPSIRQGLDALYELNRKIDKPMELLETSVKGKMKAFKVKELQAAQEAQRKQDEEKARLQRLADEAAAMAAAASTPQLRGRFEKQAQAAVIAQDVLAQQEAPAPVVGFNTSVRSKKKWRLVDRKALAKAVADGTYDPEWVSFSPEAERTLNELLKSDPEALAAYPGIEVYDDLSIVGR